MLTLSEHLRFVLSLVNKWLRFGEAKNAAALAFAGAAVGLYIRSIDILSFPLAARLLVSGGIAAFTVAGFCALVSFIPILARPFVHSERAPRDSDNLLNFGDIAYYQPSEFLTHTKDLLGIQNHEMVHEHYAHQVVINARIALRKYRIFNLVCWSGLTGIAFLGLGALTRLLG